MNFCDGGRTHTCNDKMNTSVAAVQDYSAIFDQFTSAFLFFCICLVFKLGDEPTLGFFCYAFLFFSSSPAICWCATVTVVASTEKDVCLMANIQHDTEPIPQISTGSPLEHIIRYTLLHSTHSNVSLVVHATHPPAAVAARAFTHSWMDLWRGGESRIQYTHHRHTDRHARVSSHRHRHHATRFACVLFYSSVSVRGCCGLSINRCADCCFAFIVRAFFFCWSSSSSFYTFACCLLDVCGYGM